MFVIQEKLVFLHDFPILLPFFLRQHLFALFSSASNFILRDVCITRYKLMSLNMYLLCLSCQEKDDDDDDDVEGTGSKSKKETSHNDWWCESQGKKGHYNPRIIPLSDSSSLHLTCESEMSVVPSRMLSLHGHHECLKVKVCMSLPLFAKKRLTLMNHILFAHNMTFLCTQVGDASVISESLKSHFLEFVLSKSCLGLLCCVMECKRLSQVMIFDRQGNTYNSFITNGNWV